MNIIVYFLLPENLLEYIIVPLKVITGKNSNLFIEMALSWVAVFGIVTGIWAAIGIIGPLMVPSVPGAEVYRVSIALTAVCCWLHWLLCYMHQVNPLMGPLLGKEAVQIIEWSWEN